MSRDLSTILKIEANKIASPDAWLCLLKITFTVDKEKKTYYFVNDNSPIVFKGEEYEALAFEIKLPDEISRGEIPTVELYLSNINLLLQEPVESVNGAIGSKVQLYVVNSSLLDKTKGESNDFLEWNFDVLSTRVNAQWIIFSLGAQNPLLLRFPLYRYISEHCNWQFKSVECGYEGDE